MAQAILNKANCKNDFTTNLTQNTGRYIVGITSLYQGLNPSLDFSLIQRICGTLDEPAFDSIGGWLDKDGQYYLDANFHFDELTTAMSTARVTKQIAIFDTQGNKVIKTEDDA